MDDPKAIIVHLLGSGMSEAEIIVALREDGVEVTKATINRIKNGVIRRTGFDIGMALVRLRERRRASGLSEH